jgi:adenylyl-sulfate kinase
MMLFDTKLPSTGHVAGAQKQESYHARKIKDRHIRSEIREFLRFTKTPIGSPKNPQTLHSIMIIDLLRNHYQKDPTVKRHLTKAITWRFVGTLDTILLGFLITGDLPTGVRIGVLELFTKILLYFIHERIWVSIPFGMPEVFKRQRKKTQETANLFRQQFAINRQERERKNGHPAFTIWFTGLSGSGKSTLASAIDQWLFEQGFHSYIIDGDNTRMGINSDLNFSREGREENIRRVAELCRLFNDAGIIVISSFISPFMADRARAKNIIGANAFHEVHIAASLETCIQRDTKGLYQKALKGEIRDFTGVNSPYEAPVDPVVRLDTDHVNMQDCLQTLKAWLITKLPSGREDLAGT